MNAYYNEIAPYPAQWLRNLVAAGRIAAGTVDERSIRDVRPDELAGFDQCHFFAGLGGWSLALRLAGWADDVPVWTGSCPCQPFSRAGARRGTDDERHLWPAWFALIRECRPPVVFGEQVAGPDGMHWLDAVCSDLEAAGYAVGAADLAAASVGAPHIRQRLYFVALSRAERRPLCDGAGAAPGATGRGGVALGMADGLGHADGHGAGQHAGELQAHEGEHAQWGADGDHGSVAAGATGGAWADAEWLPCIDGKWRPAQPGAFPLADGLPGRVGRLRAYGNAIVPPLAAEFIRAVMECM